MIQFPSECLADVSEGTVRKSSSVSAAQVVEIRTIWAREPEVTVKQLAQRLGIKAPIISCIVRWKTHVAAGGPMNRRAVRRAVR